MKATANSARNSALPQPPSDGRQRRHFKTMPEQIADEIVIAIIKGEYRSGERLIEQTLAAQYGVSRGPIREALRILVQRGLAIIYPRRGACVAELSLDALIDLFNVRAVLVGLAVRYYALLAESSAVDILNVGIERLAACVHADESDLEEFLREVGRVNNIIARNCGSEVVGRMIEQQATESAWSSLWQSGRLDFQSHERRSKFAVMYANIADAISARDGVGAEALMRQMIMDSCRHASSLLQQQRGEALDSRRLTVL